MKISHAHHLCPTETDKESDIRCLEDRVEMEDTDPIIVLDGEAIVNILQPKSANTFHSYH